VIDKKYLKQLLHAGYGNNVVMLTAEQSREILKWIESLEAGDCRFECRKKK
jgi:hypothetical protein